MSAVQELSAGTYLDTEHPSTCTGKIREWQMCYYTSSIQTSDSYGLSIGIWRWSSDTNEYSSVEGSDRNVSVQIEQGNNALISCITEQVEPVSIQSGDIAGIVWTQNDMPRLLPIVADGNQDSQLFDLSLNETRLGLALHLYASFEGSGTTTVKFPGGSIAAIVVVMVVVFAGVVVAVVLLGVLYWRRRGYNVIIKSKSGGSTNNSSVKKQSNTVQWNRGASI